MGGPRWGMPYDGSVMSGSMRGSMRGSSFQRGGSMRGSDRSMTMGGARSAAKRDIDDLALSNILPGGTINRPMPSTPRMAHNTQFLPHNNGHSLQMQQHPQLSLASSRETGYI